MVQAGRLVWELGQGLRRRFERFTKKQMGDAGEMLVAAELTLHGIPAFIVPSQWRGFDVVGQCPERGLQRISVKTRNFGSSRNFVSTTTRTNLTGSPSWSCLPRRDISAVSSSFRVRWRTVALMSRHTGMAAASTCTNSLDGPPLHPTRARTSIVALLTTKTISV